MVYYTNKNEYITAMMDKYGDMVYRIAINRTRHKENSEDVFQEVFIRLARKLPRFENDEHEKSWIIRVTINCTKNFLNLSFLKHETELVEDISFETKERHEIYYSVLKLPLKYRTIIYLYYYEGYNINEISEILNMNGNTVKSNLLRAREQLKFDMEEV